MKITTSCQFIAMMALSAVCHAQAASSPGSGSGRQSWPRLPAPVVVDYDDSGYSPQAAYSLQPQKICLDSDAFYVPVSPGNGMAPAGYYGYVDPLNQSYGRITYPGFYFYSNNSGFPGFYRLVIDYANGGDSDLMVSLSSQGAVLYQALAFPPTGGWNAWKKLVMDIDAAGSYQLQLESMTEGGAPNLGVVRIGFNCAESNGCGWGWGGDSFQCAGITTKTASSSTSSGSSGAAASGSTSSSSSGSSSSGSSSGGITCAPGNINTWSGGFVLNTITVTNSGNSSISGWSVALAFNQNVQITSAWNATAAASGSSITATNASYNGNLAPGQSTSFGLQGSFSGSSLPAPACTAAN